MDKKLNKKKEEINNISTINIIKIILISFLTIYLIISFILPKKTNLYTALALMIIFGIPLIISLISAKKKIKILSNEIKNIEEETELEKLDKQIAIEEKKIKIQMLNQEIENNKSIYCEYCGTKLINNKCTNCGASIHKQ